MTTSYFSVTDQFCGAGGSSLGASHAGAEIKLALNHWQLAIKTHNTNFPNTDHDCTDLSACDPRRYRPTTLLITSPECTNHSLAKGAMRKAQRQLDMFGTVEADPAEERSRATMWDVCRFAEAHRYPLVIVENVVEARNWEPFDGWLMSMHLLGYEHRIVYFNSMFAHPTPQSRDRMYVVFWRKGQRAPNLDFHPPAHCPQCGKDVQAVQSWKKPTRKWGKYGQQYVYRCPSCASQVTPYYYCAANAIDWSLPAPRIGDRARPLKDKTRRRIQVGLDKFGRQPIVVDYVHTPRGDRQQDMVYTVDRPQRTQLGIVTHALVTPPPFIVNTSHPEDGKTVKQWPIDRPMPTQTNRAELSLVMPPLLIPLEHGDNQARPITDPAPTQTTAQGTGILVSLNHSNDRARSVDDAFPTAMPQGNPFLVKFRGDEAASQLIDAVGTVTAGGIHHGVVVPFLTSFYGNIQQSSIDEPVPTQTSVDRHGLVMPPPFILGMHKDVSYRRVSDALQTVVGEGNHHFLAQPGETPAIDDCGFRMLQPHEIGAAMAFPATYTVLGTQREKVKQYGNAVTPPVMQWLVARCLESLQ